MLIVYVLTLVFLGQVQAGADGLGRHTGAQAAYYFDSRQFNTLTLVASTDNLPLGLASWGFVDLHSTPDRGSERHDMTRYFVEYRLLRAVDPAWIGGFKGLGLVTEYNDLEGGGNALLRFGISYKKPMPFGRLQLRLFPVETDGEGGQVALSYLVRLHSRFHIVGFVDYNLVPDGANRWVTEPQLVCRLAERFSLLAEWRYNQFESDRNGLALGGEVIF